jgi:hypothetical protein
MKTHHQIVAVLHIAFGALSLIFALIIFGTLGLAGGIVVSQGETEAAGILGIVALFVGGFLVLLSLPGIIGGWALYTGRSWARPVVLVLAILQLANIPFGTALGIYTLWALLYEPQPQPQLPGQRLQPST